MVSGSGLDKLVREIRMVYTIQEFYELGLTPQALSDIFDGLLNPASRSKDPVLTRRLFPMSARPSGRTYLARPIPPDPTLNSDSIVPVPAEAIAERNYRIFSTIYGIGKETVGNLAVIARQEGLSTQQIRLFRNHFRKILQGPLQNQLKCAVYEQCSEPLPSVRPEPGPFGSRQLYPSISSLHRPLSVH